MISSQLTMVIDNDAKLSETFYVACVTFMRRRGWLAGDDRFAEPDIDMAKAMGNMVEEFLWNMLKLKGISDDEKSFLSTLLVIMFSNVDWENVGAYYWQKTRERYLYVTETS